MKKLSLFFGILILFLLAWGATGLWSSIQFGPIGAGGTVLIGFAALPVLIRLAIYRIFQTEKTGKHGE